ncbi:MAG: cell division protein FtsQ/DivIB [Paludibacteraceae bacterium]|nr:cell division protein FtsQ/DivIB [Paludibacteraceae bacterium]
MRKEWGKIVALVAILGYMVFAVWMFTFRSTEQVCRSVFVEIRDSSMLRFITEREVIRLLEREEMSPVGSTMKDVKLDKLELMLKKQPRIKRAECFKTPNGNVGIVILQREPVLRVISGGRSYYVDSEGAVMPESHGFTAYVPVASGHVSETLAKNELYDFAMFLRKHKFWNAQVEQIYVEANGEIELVPRVGDQVILLGSLENYEYKLEKLLSVYKNGFSRTGWNKYRMVNLKFDNQVVCTKK